MQTKKSTSDYIQWFVLVGIALGKYVEFSIGLLLLLLCRRKYKCPKVWLVSICLLAHFYFIDLITDYPSAKFWQQFTAITILLFGYYQFYHNYVPSKEELWRKVLRLSLWLCYIGYVQYIVFLVTGNDYIGHIFSKQEMVETRVRMTSVFLEPGNFAAFIVPSVAYSFFNKENQFYTKREKLAVLIAMLLSFTTIGYLMLALVITYAYRKILLKYVWVFAVPIVMFVGFVVNYSVSGEKTDSKFSGMLTKFSNSYQMLGNLSYDDLAMAGDLSTFAIYSNLWVAQEAPCRIVGTGLGTHEYSYEKIYRNTGSNWYGINKTDAYSLYTRIFSEFGYVGLLLGALFLYRYHNFKDPKNVALLFYFISLLIRGGFYFMYGVIFFFYLYYYTSERNKKVMKNGKIEKYIGYQR